MVKPSPLQRVLEKVVVMLGVMAQCAPAERAGKAELEEPHEGRVLEAGGARRRGKAHWWQLVERDCLHKTAMEILLEKLRQV